MKKLLLTASISLLITGCTWVQLTTEGQGVRLAGAQLVTNCDRIGRTTARTLGKIATVDRGGEKLQTELLTLARNEAGRMGGDTIVPESIVSQGEQEFGVYSCSR